MALRVGVDERSLKQQIKQAGGRWVAERKVWALRHEQVEALGLTARVVGRLEDAA